MQEAIVAGAKELEELIQSASPTIVVLCSEDGAYLDFAKELNTDVPIVIAGYPVDVLEELKAAGASDFIHVRLDQLETLQRYHEKFGIPEIPLDEPLLPEAK